MTNLADSPPFLPALRTLGHQFRLIGIIGFWVKLVLGLVSAGIVLFASVGLANPVRTFAPGQVVPLSNGPSIGIGIPLLIAGVICLGISIIWSFSFTRFAQRFLIPTPQMQPSKAETARHIKLSLITDLIGMAFMVVGAETIGGVLFGKALSQGMGFMSLNIDPSRFVQPLDLLVILACIHSIAGLFIGLVGSLWLLQQTFQQKLPIDTQMQG